jgi:hypothetical protein
MARPHAQKANSQPGPAIMIGVTRFWSACGRGRSSHCHTALYSLYRENHKCNNSRYFRKYTGWRQQLQVVAVATGAQRL